MLSRSDVEEWQCKRSPWLLPLNFNNLNTCNSTKDSLFHAQTCLKDLHIVTSKCEPMGMNHGGENEEKL